MQLGKMTLGETEPYEKKILEEYHKLVSEYQKKLAKKLNKMLNEKGLPEMEFE